MTKYSIAFFYCIIALNISAQTWEVTEIGELPEPVSNNAFCEGFIAETPYLYSFGGIDTTKNYLGIHLHSYRTNTITGVSETLADLPDTLGKIAAGASRINDTIYIIGGYHVFSNGNELSSNKVHRFNINSNSFMTDATEIPIATDDHVQVIWRDSLIYVITGWSNTSNIPNVQIYNPFTNSWTAGTSTPNNNIFKSFGASGTIVGDTIYYFGGASSGFGFNIQNQLRKGIINPNDPTDITWNFYVLDQQINGYRMACTNIGNQIHWIGGSNETYNYDGIAYNNTGGVTPNNRDLYLNTEEALSWTTNYTQNYPMDLRGIASINDSLKYLAGGMLANQKVTDKVYELKWKYTLTNLDESIDNYKFTVYPNPIKQGELLYINTTNKDLEKGTLELFNIEGKSMIKSQLSLTKKEFETSSLSKGVYFLKLTTNYSSIIKKVIIQ